MASDIERIQGIVDMHRTRPGATLPVLHDIQHEFGYIPDEAVSIVADGLNLSRAEIFGVITFYADFRTSPPGRHVVQVCRGEACQAKGGEELESHARKSLGCDFRQTTADRRVTLEQVFCLGNCGCSPSVRIGDDVYGRVDSERFDELIGDLQKGAER